MKVKKGIPSRESSKAHFDKAAERRRTPPRVAPRQQPVVKNMRTRSKKASLSDKK